MIQWFEGSRSSSWWWCWYIYIYAYYIYIYIHNMYIYLLNFGIGILSQKVSPISKKRSIRKPYWNHATTISKKSETIQTQVMDAGNGTYQCRSGVPEMGRCWWFWWFFYIEIPGRYWELSEFKMIIRFLTWFNWWFKWFLKTWFSWFHQEWGLWISNHRLEHVGTHFGPRFFKGSLTCYWKGTFVVVIKRCPIWKHSMFTTVTLWERGNGKCFDLPLVRGLPIATFEYWMISGDVGSQKED